MLSMCSIAICSPIFVFIRHMQTHAFDGPCHEYSDLSMNMSIRKYILLTVCEEVSMK